MVLQVDARGVPLANERVAQQAYLEGLALADDHPELYSPYRVPPPPPPPRSRSPCEYLPRAQEAGAAKRAAAAKRARSFTFQRADAEESNLLASCHAPSLARSSVGRAAGGATASGVNPRRMRGTLGNVRRPPSLPSASTSAAALHTAAVVRLNPWNVIEHRATWSSSQPPRSSSSLTMPVPPAHRTAPKAPQHEQQEPPQQLRHSAAYRAGNTVNLAPSSVASSRFKAGMGVAATHRRQYSTSPGAVSTPCRHCMGESASAPTLRTRSPPRASTGTPPRAAADAPPSPPTARCGGAARMAQCSCDEAAEMVDELRRSNSQGAQTTLPQEPLELQAALASSALALIKAEAERDAALAQLQQLRASGSSAATDTAAEDARVLGEEPKPPAAATPTLDAWQDGNERWRSAMHSPEADRGSPQQQPSVRILASPCRPPVANSYTTFVTRTSHAAKALRTRLQLASSSSAVSIMSGSPMRALPPHGRHVAVRSMHVRSSSMLAAELAQALRLMG